MSGSQYGNGIDEGKKILFVRYVNFNDVPTKLRMAALGYKEQGPCPAFQRAIKNFE